MKIFCGKVGRSYDDIERAVLATINLTSVAMNATEVVELCQGLADITPLVIFGKEIIPDVAELDTNQ